MEQQLAATADQLRAVAALFYTPMNTLTKARANLIANLPSGAPWGDDDNGEQFGKQYVPARDNTFKALVSTTRNMGINQANLLRMADSYEDTEFKNAH